MRFNKETIDELTKCGYCQTRTRLPLARFSARAAGMWCAQSSKYEQVVGSWMD